MKSAYLLSGALLTALTLSAPSAQAQTHDLYFAQAGAALTYSWAEVRLLYGAVTARTYDPKITSETIDELKKAIGGAKRQIDRATALLPNKMSKFEPRMEKLRKAVVRVEQTLAKLENDIIEQTKALVEEEEETELGTPLDEEPEANPPKVDWKLLKNGTAWLAQDIKAARSRYKEAAMKVARVALKTPPRPRGKRK